MDFPINFRGWSFESISTQVLQVSETFGYFLTYPSKLIFPVGNLLTLDLWCPFLIVYDNVCECVSSKLTLLCVSPSVSQFLSLSLSLEAPPYHFLYQSFSHLLFAFIFCKHVSIRKGQGYFSLTVSVLSFLSLSLITLIFITLCHVTNHRGNKCHAQSKPRLYFNISFKGVGGVFLSNTR